VTATFGLLYAVGLSGRSANFELANALGSRRRLIAI
jgi:hypothetical protein